MSRSKARLAADFFAKLRYSDTDESVTTESVEALTGTIIYVAANVLPAGYLKADGSAVSRTTYASLFSVIGTTYGSGDGSTTFNLPDLRGEFIRGADDGRGVDSGRSVGSTQADELKSHRHYYNQYSYSSGLGGGGSSVTRVGGNALVTNYTGGDETRPRNVAMLACIKY